MKYFAKKHFTVVRTKLTLLYPALLKFDFEALSFLQLYYFDK